MKRPIACGNLILVALVFLLLVACSVKETAQGGSGTQTTNVKLDTIMVDTNISVSDSLAERILLGYSANIGFAGQELGLKLLQDSAHDPVLELTTADTAKTYFRKKSSTIVQPLRKSGVAQVMLEGVWVAFSQLSHGEWSALDTSANNQLSMTLTTLETGMQMVLHGEGVFMTQTQNSEYVLSAWTPESSSSSVALISSSSLAVQTTPFSSAATSSSLDMSSSAASVGTLCNSDSYASYFVNYNTTFYPLIDIKTDATCLFLDIYPENGTNYYLSISANTLVHTAKLFRVGTEYPQCTVSITTAIDMGTGLLAYSSLYLANADTTPVNYADLNTCALFLQTQ